MPPADDHTDAETRADSPAREPSKITRRTALALLGVATGTTALLHPSGAAPASAAVVWGHPFASYRTWSYGFGERDGRLHAGIDYPSAYSIPIHAVADGTVYNVGWHSGYGNFAEIMHANGWLSFYAHMASPSPLAIGQAVARGAYVGPMGNTGNSFGIHLHVEIRQRPGGSQIDPAPYIHRGLLPSDTVPPAPPEPKPEEDEDMFKIIHAANDGHIYIVGMTGKRARIGTVYHAQLLQRLRAEDTLLTAELDICQQYLAQVA